MVSGMKEGFSNLYNGNKKFAHTVNGLKADFLTLKNSIASAFAPIVTVAIPYLQSLANAMSAVMDKAAQFFAAITGQKTYLKAIKQSTDAIEEQGKEASKANKKQLSGLDKLNNLSSDDKSSNGDSSGSGIGDMFEEADVGINFEDLAKKFKDMWEKADFTELGAAIGQKLKEGLESIPWDDVQKTAEKVGKSFATLINGFVTVPGLATTIGNTIAQAINTGLKGLDAFAKNLDWGAVGKFIADGINGALLNIDWNTALSAASSFGTGIATLLNNALTPEVFQNIGTTIGNGINTALTFAYSFLETFDWLQFGEGLAGLINTALVTLDTKKLGETLGAGLRAVIQTAFGFVTNLDFNELGKKIGDIINGFFEEMGKVDKKTGLTGWQELGQTVSKSITGILDTINTALSTVDWDKVGKAIGGFITSVDWAGIFAKVGKLIVNVLWSAIKLALSALSSDPLGIAHAADTIIAGWFTFKGLSLVFTKLKATFSKILEKALLDATNALETGGIKGLLQTKLGKIGAIAISLTIAVEAINWAHENWSSIFEEYSMDEIAAGLDEMFEDLFGDNFISQGMAGLSLAWGTILSGEYSWSEWGEGIAAFASDAWEGIKLIFSDIGDWFGEKFSDAWDAIKSVWSGVKKFFSGIWSGITGVFGSVTSWFKGIFSGAWNGIKSIWSAVTGFFSGIWNGIKSVFSSVGTWFKNIFLTAWNGIKSIWNGVTGFFSNVWSGIKGVFGSAGIWFKDKFSTAWSGIKNVFSSVGGFFSNVWSNIKGAFGNIAGWFKDKFSSAWTAVKNVFSTGGKIFDGIKDGILSGLKSVINGIIGGINKVIEVPFNGINTALKKLKDVSILGAKPFGFLPTISVPQIPKLATGAVIPANKEFLAVLGDQKNGRNLEAPEGLIRKIIREETAGLDRGSGDINLHLVVECEGYRLLQLIQKLDKEQFDRTGKPSFEM